ncbi:MAG TPA: hypothetical protein VFG54_19275 [Prolixibacteraceae bacterium]|nr:hypothetical protein [Prolixibacteraceae bacterium]
MAPSNFERLVQLADDVFAVKNDPSQLDVNDDVLAKLRQMHPATVADKDDGNGPVAWVLVIPTTLELMNRFVKGEISEKELFDLTPIEATYEALYLCAALVLEEYRRKGIAHQLTLKAAENIRKDHPLKCLFVWPFSNEGDELAEIIAREISLPLFRRQHV